MKVIKASNFDDESVAEELIQENLTPVQAAEVAREWNDKHASDNSRYYALIVSDGHKLWRGLEEYI